MRVLLNNKFVVFFLSCVTLCDLLLKFKEVFWWRGFSTCAGSENKRCYPVSLLFLTTILWGYFRQRLKGVWSYCYIGGKCGQTRENKLRFRRVFLAREISGSTNQCQKLNASSPAAVQTWVIFQYGLFSPSFGGRAHIL